MRAFVKYIVERTYKPWLVKYLSKTRRYSYKGIILEVPPEVFHPGFFTSTRLLYRFISKQSLKRKTVLELGAGSGLLSMFAAKKGASVTATDINKKAIQFLHINATSNSVNLEIIYSDLFDGIPKKQFDLVLINPPYYKKDPSSEPDYAWYCGKNGEYFQRLFAGLKNYVHSGSEALMVLCDGCDLEMIRKMAEEKFFVMQCVFTKKTVIEKNYIFKILSAQWV